jgi:AcrR family transcriptional regulator
MNDRATHILDAACRVIAREGADGLRMSAVASEAGVSTALLHYYFATRSDLLLEAFKHADDQAGAILDRLMEGAPNGAAKIERVLVGYTTGSEFRADWVLWIEMWRGALFDTRLRPLVRDSTEEWVEQVAGLIREGADDGSLPEVPDPVGTAHRLTSLVDGLGLQVLTGILDLERSEKLVREAIDRELNIVRT